MIVLGVLLTVMALFLALATAKLLINGEVGPGITGLALTAGVAVLADFAFGV
jgi:hypothetical protein